MTSLAKTKGQKSNLKIIAYTTSTGSLYYSFTSTAKLISIVVKRGFAREKIYEELYFYCTATIVQIKRKYAH
jgi:hypothetical protein